MRYISGFMSLAVFLIGTACSDLSEPSSAVPVNMVNEYTGVSSVKNKYIRMALNNESHRGIEDEMLLIEAEIPGFGGFFVDQSSTLVAYSEAKQSIEQMADRIGIPKVGIYIRIVEAPSTSFANLSDYHMQPIGGVAIQAYPGADCSLGYNVRGYSDLGGPFSPDSMYRNSGPLL